MKEVINIKHLKLDSTDSIIQVLNVTRVEYADKTTDWYQGWSNIDQISPGHQITDKISIEKLNSLYQSRSRVLRTIPSTDEIKEMRGKG